MIPIGGGTNKDALPQDPDSEVVNLKLNQFLNDVTLANDLTLGTRTINLSPGHSVAIGNYLCFVEGKRFTQSLVIGVNVNEITLESPIDYAYTTNADVHNSNPNIAKVDGSTTPIEFYLTPPAGMAFDVYAVHLVGEYKNAPGPTKFFGESPITNGLYLRKEDGSVKNYWTIRRDADFREYGMVPEHDPKAPAGNYLTYCPIKPRNDNGVVLRLRWNEKLIVGVQDDFLAMYTLGNLIRITATAIGHVVV